MPCAMPAASTSEMIRELTKEEKEGLKVLFRILTDSVNAMMGLSSDELGEFDLQVASMMEILAQDLRSGKLRLVEPKQPI